MLGLPAIQSQSELEAQVPLVAATLLQIFEEQRDSESVDVLRHAISSVVLVRWDGWNDETAVHELVLTIPPVTFARLEKTLEQIEERIAEKLPRLPVGGPTQQLRSVRVCPQLLVGPGGGSSISPSAGAIARIWESGRIRMFISHVSKHRLAASKMKDALGPMGVCAFVAHEDVEPTLEWQTEIETALQSMDVFCALLTPEFRSSRWTDQEIGFALGRNVPIIAMRLGEDPYGFIGKIQGVQGSLSNPEELATNSFNAVLRLDALRTKTIDALVGAVAQSASFADAKSGMKRLTAQQNALTRTQVERLLRAARDNSQVKEAFGVAEQIRQIAKKAGVVLPKQPLQVNSDDATF
jgi:hypothetical protein